MPIQRCLERNRQGSPCVLIIMNYGFRQGRAEELCNMLASSYESDIEVESSKFLYPQSSVKTRESLRHR